MRLASKFEKSSNMTFKKIVFEKNQKKYHKTQNFTLTSNSLKKFYKYLPKKVISKNVTEICTFSTFTHVRQTCFAYKFFCAFFKILNQHEI